MRSNRNRGSNRTANIGLATFQLDNIPKKLAYKLEFQINIKIKTKILAKPLMKITHGQFTKYQWSEIFENMSEIKCVQFNLQFNDFAQILKPISVPCYSRLVDLYLSKNMISNIEQMAFMNVPLLQVLAIDRNYITQIKSLGKSNTKNLSQIDLTNNPLCQIDFHRIKFFHLMFSNYADTFGEKVQTQNLNVLAKLQPKEISNFEVCVKQKSIQQEKAYDSLKRKYKFQNILGS